MKNRISLKLFASGVLLVTSAFAQTPPAPASAFAVVQGPTVTQSSRIRAFNLGPGGEIRSLYLSNGSVVDVAPGLGVQLAVAAQKGARTTVTGVRSDIKGQVMLAANRITINGQTFDAPGPDTRGFALPPPPPPAAALRGLRRPPADVAGGTMPPPPGDPVAPPPPPPPSAMRAPGPCGNQPPPPPPATPAGSPVPPAGQ